MPLYEGNYVAPVWVNGIPPTIGETELDIISRVIRDSQTIKGNGAPTAQTQGVVGQLYADMSATPPAIYRCFQVSGQAYSWGTGGNIDANLAQEYDSTSTYAEGAYCLHEGLLYQASTTIATAEAWNSAHWTQVRAADEVREHVQDRANPHEVTAAQIGLGNVENVLQYSPDNPAVKLGTVSLSGVWSGSGGVYTQTVTVTGATVTASSHVELQFTSAQAETLTERGVGSIYVENNAGTLTAIAIGGRPSAMTVQCTVEETQIVKAYLEFHGNSSFTLATYENTKIWNDTMESSTDGVTWTVWDGTTTLTSGTGNSLYLRGTGNSRVSAIGGEPGFSFGGAATAIECNGDMETLRDYQTIARGESISSEANFSCLFADISKLVSAPKLSAQRVRVDGYFRLFDGTSITEAPELPATRLSNGTEYAKMFANTPITKAPELPATVIDYATYEGMFLNCTSLDSLAEIRATNFQVRSCSGMYQGCTKIKLSTTQSNLYNTPYRLPASGTGTAGTNAFLDMFSGTGGTFTGTPSINTTYYTSNVVV